MPKNKRPIESTRTSSRRQASKEALKQMQLLLDDEDEDAFVIPEDEDDKKDVRLEPPPPPPPKKRAISPMMESPTPKKKYKLSHRKSSDGNDRDVIVLKSISNSNYVPKENTLELECFIEDLSDVQKERQKKSENEEKELQAKLEELLKSKNAEVVYKGEISSAVEVNELITNCGKKSIFKPSELPQIDEKTPAYHLVMDPRLGLIVGTIKSTKPVPKQVQTPPPPITKSKLQISAAVKDVATIPQNSTTPTRNMRTRKSVIPTPPPTIQTRGNNSIPTRANSHGVITRGNTPRSNNSAPARVVPQMPSPVPSPTIQTRGMKSTPPIQTRSNKATPPSTSKRPVVNAPVEKPSKQVVDLTSEDSRNQADNREISFNKLQGKTYPSLVVVARPHLRVTDLGVDRSKLDSKVKTLLMHQPTKFTEWLIQQGLIRAEQKCPVHSNTQLKLGMYSDVSKFPFSGGYVWISECCPQRFVSVFNGSIFEGSPHPPMVILKLIYHWSCQTNIQNVTQWVKVDNLYVKGVYTWLRGVCTMAVQSRLPQLGGPFTRIEVGVISLGTTSHDGNQRQVKVEVLGVLESSTKYVRLRAVEPMPDGDRNFRKKFSKILEPILHWVHPASTIVTDLTVDKATLHHMGFTNVTQTTSNEYNQSNRTIMEYLRRIVPRMFQNTLSLLSRQIIQQFLDELVWREWFGNTSQTAFENIIAHLAEQTRLNPQTPLVLKLNKVAANPFRSWSTPTQNQVASNSTTPAPVAPPATTTTPVVAKTPVAEVKKYGRGKKSNSPQVQVVQERPTKPVSPDVPEQMVPLENYYYGTIDPINTSPMKITLNMKCPFCKSSFDNNILLQNHLFKHAHNVSNDAYLCRYCLTSVSTANELIHHVNKCHPGDTKFDYGFVCLICEIHYMNPFVLGKHMSKEHIPHELPYQCGSCTFRCSNHKQVIDHFYLKHDGGSSIQCPFCLKSTTVWAGGRNVGQNIHYFIQHLQKHQKKQFAKRCGKCNLWFVQKEVLKEHQQKMHISLRGKMGLVPYPSPRNGVMVPKSKIDKNPCDAEVINFSSLYYNLSNNSICKECNHAISSSKHFPSFDNCQNPNCQYSTCCAIAMMTHNAKCKGLNSVIPPEALPFEMFCVCGFKDVDGNSMAKHLAVCEKKSAYPSEAEAKSATVMHSMLDILGLVRKPEESKNEKPSDNCNILDKNESIQDSSKVSNKEIDSNEINILSDEEIEAEITNSDKANENSVVINSENVISEKKSKKSKRNESETDKKPADVEEISDENDEISGDKKVEEVVHKKSDVIDLDEEDAIMSEVLNEFPQCEPSESKHICDKTEEIGTDSIAEKHEPEAKDLISEIGINDTNSNPNNEGKQINLHTIEERNPTEHKSKEDHVEMEVDGDQTEINMHVTEAKIVNEHADENMQIDHRDIKADHEKEDETIHTETEIDTEKDIVAGHAEKVIVAGHTEKVIVADHTESEGIEDDTLEDMVADQAKKEIVADQTETGKMEKDHADEDIVADCTEKEILAGHPDKGIVAGHTEKEIVGDRTEKENIKEEEEDMVADHTEREVGARCIEKEIVADQTEKEKIIEEEDDMVADHSDREVGGNCIETEKEADKTEKEVIKEDHTEDDKFANHTKKGIVEDHTEKEEIEKYHTDEEKEADHADKEKLTDLSEKDFEADHTEKEGFAADHTEIETGVDPTKKETEVDPTEKEIKAHYTEEETQTNCVANEFVADFTEKRMEVDHIEEGMGIKLNKVEEGHIQGIGNNMDEIGKDNAETTYATNHSQGEIENIRLDNDLFTQAKLNSNESNNSTEENSEDFPNSGITKNNEYINEEVSSIKSSDENDKIEGNHESVYESASEKQTDGTKDFVIQETEPFTSQNKLNESRENNLTVDAMDCSEISTSCMEKNELDEVVDNDNSEPCIGSENEDIMKDILPTGDVIPINSNSLQGSTSMDVD